MDKIDILKGKGLLTKIKGVIVPKANEILGKVILGYDYRAKKNRLNTDQSVRDKLSRELEKVYDTLKEVSDLAYQDERREVLTHIKDTLNTIDLFQKEIKSSPYGLSPWFKQEKVSERDLVKMIEFDANLLDEIEVITSATDLVYDKVLEGKTSDIILQVRKIKSSLDKMKNVYSDRKDFLINLV